MRIDNSQSAGQRLRRVLVTGGNGYLGTELLKLALGVEVFAIVNCNTDRLNTLLPASAIRCIGHDFAATDAFVQEIQPDAIIHLAAVHAEPPTFALLSALAARDPRVRAFRFSKNFGYQRSILTGYMKARGAAAIQLDVDLQDPPELIERFIQTWEQGADVVYGVRMERKEGWAITKARAVFYRLIDLLSEEKLPVDAGDFRLISRRVIDLVTAYQDANPYLRGTIATLGFEQVGIPYTRNARERGESKFPLSKLLSLALDGILAHSTVPLRVATWCGLAISLLTILIMAGYAIGRLVFERPWPAGFTTLAALILISISINAMLLGIIGEYLGRMYRQQRAAPVTIIEQSIDPDSESVATLPRLI